jgi:phosphatidylglycerophosphatase A
MNADKNETKGASAGTATHISSQLADRLAAAITTLFGVGFIPRMPGTLGSLAALLLLLVPVAEAQRWMLLAAACVMSFGLGLLLIPRMESRFGSDAQCVVLDEALGMWLVLLAPVPHTLGWTLAGFVLFRAFDITKPFPANRFNARHGALWVLLDDVAAGGYAALVLWLAAWLIAQAP